MKCAMSERVNRRGRVSRLYRFANDYGASVLRLGAVDAGLYELAVIRWNGDDWDIDCGNGITGDVIGGLNDAAVDALLDKIEALPKKGG